jgi:hypothetical protein
MIEISNSLADCIMPYEERINYKHQTANWTMHYCEGFKGPAEGPSLATTDPSTSSPTERPSPVSTEPSTPLSTSAPLPRFTDVPSPTTEETMPAPTTAVESLPLTPSPPLPALDSQCAASICKEDFDTCMKTFDSCACFPGHLRCVQISCPEDWVASMKECSDAIPLAKTCILVCAASGYPNNPPEESTVVMTVVASIVLSGLKVAEFKAVEPGFKAAMATTVKCEVQNIEITNVTEVSYRRLIAKRIFLPILARRHEDSRQLNDAASHLNIEFEITVPSANDLNTAVATLKGTMTLSFVVDHQNQWK